MPISLYKVPSRMQFWLQMTFTDHLGGKEPLFIILGVAKEVTATYHFTCQLRVYRQRSKINYSIMRFSISQPHTLEVEMKEPLKLLSPSPPLLPWVVWGTGCSFKIFWPPCVWFAFFYLFKSTSLRALTISFLLCTSFTQLQLHRMVMREFFSLSRHNNPFHSVDFL